MSKRRVKKPHGQIRQSQVVTTFGPGAMLDLPEHSVLVAGLDYWTSKGDEIVEPRLTDRLAAILEVPRIQLYPPPSDAEETALDAANVSGITGWQFPEWFITQDVEGDTKAAPIRSRRLVHRRFLSKGKFIDESRKKRPVVPIRFVRACPRGHIHDIDWYLFVHGEKTSCRRPLWIDERGTSGDLSEVFVRCECGRERSVSTASIPSNRGLSTCDGARPWLGPSTGEVCGEPNRLLVRTASNAYFPQLMSVISLPDRDEAVRKAVDAVWDFVEAVESLDDLRHERKKAKVKAALDGLSDEVVFSELQCRKSGLEAAAKPVKVAELETLMAAQDQIGEDQPDGDFYARTLPRSEWDAPWMQKVERVVLVHRLREVVAQVGFTRFEAASPDLQGELEIGVRRAALAREISWLPAIENRGEGVFIQFKTEKIENWLKRDDVENRGRQLLGGFDAWKAEHQGSKRKFFGVPYVLLHSLSHLLITTVALECGYPASSIRERVYALPGVGYGLLLYTGTTDAEGTLGGLIQVGRKIHLYLKRALELGELCSNDPVCAQHAPPDNHERRFLHGAACHGCVLIAETSCEMQNDFLDRALVVPTVDHLGVEFFPSLTESATSAGAS
jgi:hypothetical protein